MAAPDRPALREGARRPSLPVLTGPPGPVHPAPGLLRAAAAEEEASKPRGPWPERGEGEAPRGARAREPSHPRGRCRARGKGLEGALWGGGRRLRGPPGPRTLPGPLSAPGGGVAGPSWAPAPQHKQAPDAEPPGSAGGGAGRRGGPGRLVTPPCPGLAARFGGGANPLTPPPAPSGHRPPGPSGILALGVPGDLGRSAGREVSRPQPLACRGRTDQPLPTSARGQGRGHEIGLLPGGGAFPKGQGQGIPNWDWQGTGQRVIKAVAGGCPGYWGQGGISPAQAGLG